MNITISTMGNWAYGRLKVVELESKVKGLKHEAGLIGWETSMASFVKLNIYRSVR